MVISFLFPVHNQLEETAVGFGSESDEWPVSYIYFTRTTNCFFLRLKDADQANLIAPSDRNQKRAAKPSLSSATTPTTRSDCDDDSDDAVSTPMS